MVTRVSESLRYQTCRTDTGDADGPTRQRRHTAFSEAYLRLAPIPVVAYCRDTHSQGVMPLLALPEHFTGAPWAPNVQSAYEVISQVTNRAEQLLCQSALDPLRLKHHLEAVLHEALPLLVALSDSADIEDIPNDWLVRCAKEVAGIVDGLREALSNAEGR